MTLAEVKNVFVSVLPAATFHYKAWSKPDKYIVWAEDGQAGALHADDQTEEQIISGTADYFTKTEYDAIVKNIQSAMNKSDMTWYLNSVQYEEDTGYIHYEWVWEAMDSIGGF